MPEQAALSFQQETLNQSNWTRVAFGDVVRLSKLRSKDPEADGYERVVGLEHIEPGDLRIRRWADISEGTTFTSVFKPGQVLFGKRRAYQRKIAIADFHGVCSGDIYVLEPSSDALMPELLPFICQTDAFFDHAVGTSAGSLSPRTNWKSLASFEFLLPPKQEQMRLVEALRAHVRVQQSLSAAKVSLETLVQSFIDHSFELNFSGGECLSFDLLIKRQVINFKTGPFGTVLSASEYTKEGWPIVNPSNISSGKVKEFEGPHVNDETAQRLEKYRMKAGDILLSRKGEIDKACLARPENDGWIVGSDIIRLRSDFEEVRPQYLFYFLQSSPAKRMLRSHAHGTIMAGINEKMLCALEMEVPPLEAQDFFISKMSDLSAKLKNASKRLERVRGIGPVLLQNVVSGERGLE